jgi:hypothetical protein
MRSERTNRKRKRKREGRSWGILQLLLPVGGDFFAAKPRPKPTALSSLFSQH